MRFTAIKAILPAALCWIILLSSATAAKYRNVYGDRLQSCSQNGMAQTGYTRSGYCVEADDDAGSHHICIDLSSATGGNFCDVTGQSDWCSSDDMPCQGDDDAVGNTCSIQNWCVCQWAFASYIETAGGCDQIQDIVCESINLQAVLAYQNQKSHYSSALECLVDRCNLDEAELERLAKAARYGGPLSGFLLWVGLGAVAAFAVVAGYLARQRQLKKVSMDGNSLLKDKVNQKT